MTIDNFDIIRDHLEFIDTKLDRYIIHILRRPKDISQDMKNVLGANEAQRLIKTYYVDSLEYFDKKREAIKELCRANNARAYIIVQPKDNFECLMNLGQNIFKTLQNKNYSVKPEHLIRQAYCEWHKTRKKQWIIDLDKDEMVEYRGKDHDWSIKRWTVNQVKRLIVKQLRKIQKIEKSKHPDNPTWLEDQVYEVPTKNGVHIITPPFNLMEMQKECGLMFEGRKKFKERKDIGPGEYDFIEHECTGWLHKDGMTLLFLETIDK